MNILIAGDFCPQNRVAKQFEKGNFDSVLGEVKPIIEKADYSIVNFECPVTKGGEKPIVKCGPNLQCTEKGVEAVKWAGFDCVTLANNHFLDYGEEGIKNTLEVFHKNGIITVGGGVNLKEASRILLKKINGKTLAIINCCEHEFSIATSITAGSNPLDPILQYYDIQEARKHADFVIVIVHGGNEYYQLPSPRMQKTYRFFIDAGADVVVNHHQHCYSGYEVYKNKPIFYGLGNFCFDEPKNKNYIWNEGFFVVVTLDASITFTIFPYKQGLDREKICLCNEVEMSTINSSLQFLNNVILDGEKLSQNYHDYLSRENIGHIFEPYSNRYLMALYRRNLLPSFMTRKRKLLLLAYLQCESHIVKALDYLRK